MLLLHSALHYGLALLLRIRFQTCKEIWRRVQCSVEPKYPVQCCTGQHKSFPQLHECAAAIHQTATEDSGAARARCKRVSWVLARCARWILASPQPTTMSKFPWPRGRNDSYLWSSFICPSHQYSNANIWVLNVDFSHSWSSVSLSLSAKREWDPTGNNNYWSSSQTKVQIQLVWIWAAV